MTQTQEIKKYLDSGKSITALEALNRFKCFRLSARINDLKNQGVKISKEWIKTNSGKSVASYSLAGSVLSEN